MEVILAKSAGFCFGVKRAVATVFEQAEHSNKKIYTYGPIIHNDEVMKELEQKGVRVLNSRAELEALTEGCVMIRSHGVAKEIYELMERKQIEYVDATCPFVKKIHRHVEEYSGRGYRIVIAGNVSHPEVEGIMGWNQKTRTDVINSREEAENLNVLENEKICIVAQTTYNYKKFQELVEIIRKKGYDILVLNTICSATNERQREAFEIASKSDAMIVIGDRKSSNTQKLFEICKNECKNTYYIQTMNDLDLRKLQGLGTVGITAGASTPNKIIEEVQKNVRDEF